MNKPLLLYITDAETLGGAEGYLETLLVHADRARFQIGLALPPRSATAPLVEQARALGVVVDWLDVVHSDGVNLAGLTRAAAYLKQRQPAIVHFVLGGPRRAAETVLAAWLCGVPQRIATFQLVTPLPPLQGLGRAVRAANRSFQFRTLTDGVAVSHGNAALLVEAYGFPADRLHVIANSVDTMLFRPNLNSEQLRMAWGVPFDVPLIGVVGRLVTQKGQRVLLDAMPAVWAHFPAAHVVLIGSGEHERELRDAAAQLDLSRIHFAGLVPRNDMPAALAALDVFALPSLYEGLPFAVVEAMAAARPIVATEIDGTVEAITHESTGVLVAPQDSKALAEALIRLLGDAPLRARLGAAARADAKQRFSQTSMLEQTFALYR